MTTIQEAQQQTEQARQQEQQARQKLTEAQNQTNQAFSKLPDYTSQRALRQKLTGLQGRQQRVLINQTKNQLLNRRGELKKYETNLNTYKSQIDKAQAQIDAYNKQVSAFQSAKNDFNAGIFPSQVSDPIVKNYLKQMYQDYNSALDSYNATLPTPTEQSVGMSLVSEHQPAINTPNVINRVSPPAPNTIYPSVPSFTGFSVVSAQNLPAVNQTPQINQSLVLPQNLSTQGGLNKNAQNNQSNLRSSGASGNFVFNSSNNGNPSNGSTGNSGGFFSSVWSGINNLLGSSSDRQKYFQEVTNPEIYSNASGLNRFISASPTGASTTAYLRPPTPQEQEALNKANELGSYSNLPPIKFLSGGYGFQQTLSANAEAKRLKEAETLKNVPILKNFVNNQTPVTPEQYNQYVSNTPLKTIYQTGNYPAVVTKLFYTGGEKAFGGVDILRQKTLGGNQSTPTEVKTGGQILGQAGLFGFFSPALETGTYATLETPESELIYDYVKGKWVRKNKITGEIKELQITPTEFINNVRQDLLQRPAGQGQLDYLKQLYEKYYKNSPTGKEDFAKLVRNLYESGEFKGVPLEYLQSQPQNNPIVEVTMRLPRIRGIKGTGSAIQTSNILSTQTNIPAQQQPAQSGFIFSNPAQPTLQNQPNILGLIQKPSQNQKNLLLSGIGVLSLLKSPQQQKQPEPQRTGQNTNTDLSGQATIQQSKITQGNILRNPTRTTERPPKKNTPYGDILKNIFGKKSTGNSETPLSNFKVFGKRFGKEFSLGKTTSEVVAEEKLVNFLKGTLGRSGFIEKGGQPIKLNLGKEFRPSKKNPFVVVQKSKYSLGTGSERREIQFWKRKRAKKKTSWF